MEHQRLECGCRNIIDRRPGIIEVVIGDLASNVHFFQHIHLIDLNADRHRADLLIIAYNDQLFAHIQNSQRRNIRLAGLINDDNIKLIGTGIQTFQSFPNRHYPARNSTLAFDHQFTGLSTIHRSIFTCSFADFLDSLLPADQCLLHADVMLGCPQKIVPGRFLGIFCSNPAILFTEGKTTLLKLRERLSSNFLNDSIVLFPLPSIVDVTWNGSFPMDTVSSTDSVSPLRCHRSQPIQIVFTLGFQTCLGIGFLQDCKGSPICMRIIVFCSQKQCFADSGIYTFSHLKNIAVFLQLFLCISNRLNHFKNITDFWDGISEGFQNFFGGYDFRIQHIALENHITGQPHSTHAHGQHFIFSLEPIQIPLNIRDIVCCNSFWLRCIQIVERRNTMLGNQVIPIRGTLIPHGFHFHNMEDQLTVFSSLRLLPVHSCTIQRRLQLLIEKQCQFANLPTLFVFFQQLFHCFCKIRVLAENLNVFTKLLNGQSFCTHRCILNLLNQSNPQLFICIPLLSIYSAMLHPRFYFRECRNIVSQLVNGCRFRIIQCQLTERSSD